MHLPKGTLLQGGKYKIVRFISAGGFGCTYEAEHVLLQKRLAIKEFFVKDFCNRDEETAHVTVGTQSKVALVGKLRKKFIDEAVALSQMQHEGIVHVTDVFEENGTAYYVMDYIDGKSIHDILKVQTTIPEAKTVKYITQVAHALQYVHAQNRLHLDIKPGNIMVDEHDNAILIDFGASKQYDEESGENTSTLLGKTPGYAPIEQMGNSVQTFTPATDIYSLGATMYKCITGITPPEANMLVSDDEALAPLPDSVSLAVRSAVGQAMKVRAKERPQNMDILLSILEKQTASGQMAAYDEKEATKIDVLFAAPSKKSNTIVTMKKRRFPKSVAISIIGVIIVALCVLNNTLKGCENKPSLDDLLIKATLASEKGDFEKAFEILSKPEMADMAEAQYYLGMLYMQGTGVLMDSVKGKELISHAAEFGSSDACVFLGYSFYFGKNGMNKDIEKGIKYYKAAFDGYIKQAEGGDEKAQLAIGNMYHQGYAVDKDEEIANMWFAKAMNTYKKKAEAGDGAAQVVLADGLTYGLYGLEKDEFEGFKWKKVSADQGYVSGLFSLALAYEYGFGVDKDIDHAVELYKKCGVLPAAQEAIKRLQHPESNKHVENSQPPIDSQQIDKTMDNPSMIGQVSSNNVVADGGKSDTPSDQPVIPSNSPDDGKYKKVDLGLSVFWAEHNVGTNKPEGNGSYFTWGETSAKTSYTEANSETFEKEEGWLLKNGVIDGKGNLKPSHDVAKSKWGGNWRLPTKKEAEELCSKCNKKWVTENGRKGMRFIGPNGNSIFLPAAGSHRESEVAPIDYLGLYMTATSTQTFGNVILLTEEDTHVAPYQRVHGLSVRPVQSK